MRGYPDGMQRITLLACALAAAATLALPAAAQGPPGWSQGSGAQGSLTVLRAVSRTTALAAGLDGALVRTTDAGRTWSATTAPSDAEVRDLASPDGNRIYVLDSRGALLRSTDAGATWTPLSLPGSAYPAALLTFPGSRLLVVTRRSLFLSSDAGDSFEQVTPKLARGDTFRGADRAATSLVVYGPRALMVSSEDEGHLWRHLRLPPLARGDSILAADFTAAREGFVLSAFRRLYKTSDAGHHWHELLGTGGAGAGLAFSDGSHGLVAAPGFANRFDGYALYTSDGGATWRPQSVAGGFLSAVAAAGSTGYAIGNEGQALFADRLGSETGKPVTVGFRPLPRVARPGGKVTIRGRIAPPLRRVGVAVSMRSAGRWIVRFAHTNARGVFIAGFHVQRRAWFVAQVPAANGHGSAATKPVLVRVPRRR
jgi:photosystem II stability/assembly factor-like uncharacterized protein